MTIHQLSIFIENRSGTLISVLDVLKQAGIQIVASTIGVLYGDAGYNFLSAASRYGPTTN